MNKTLPGSHRMYFGQDSRSLPYVFAVLASVLVVTLSAMTPWVSEGARGLIRVAFQSVCHQRPERSFMVNGIPFAVCHRCFGIYVGIAVGLLAARGGSGFRSRFERNAVAVLILMISPMLLDWSLNLVGLLTNTTISRFTTGLIAGGAGGLFLGYAIDPNRERPVVHESTPAIS